MTTYSVFMHYYNDNVGKAVTNEINCDWYPCLTTPQEYDPKISDGGSHLQFNQMDQNKLKQDKETLEILYISPDGAKDATLNTAKYEELIVNSSNINNPKYDMIFIWDGLGYFVDDNNKFNQIYFDKMKRVQFKPWFFHSTYHSLKSAITKAEQLVNLFGKDHIMIGKEVALDQYIDIV